MPSLDPRDDPRDDHHRHPLGGGSHKHQDPFPGFPVDPDVTPESDVPPPRIHTTAIVAVAVGGALGALARWSVAQALPPDLGSFPWSTLVANVLGCFLIGVLMVLVIERWPDHPMIRLFFGTGVLGGFTTFSTYAVDTRDLLSAGHPAAALTYVAGSLVLGLAAVVVGLRATERMVAR
jgi:CrcB protein